MEQSTKNVNLWPFDRKAVEKLAKEKGLSFSAALRIIIREWSEAQEQKQSSNHKENTHPG